jgi:hypothetical protein
MSLLLGGTPAVFFIIAAAIAAALIQSLSNPSSRTANDQNDLGLGAGGAINNSVATAKPASTTPQAAAAAPSWSPEPTETGFERNPPGSRHRSASSDFASAASGSAVAEDSRTALPSQFNTEALETSSSSSPLEKPNWSFAGRTNKDRAQSYQILFARQFKMRLSAADARKISAEEKTIVVGSTDRAANITMDSARKPILGLDYAAKITDENVLGIMVPVFERSEGFTVIAEEGYALGGLRVYAREKVLGFQPIFMKLDGDTLNPTDSYTGDWEGAKGSDDQIVRLAGDGRIVCGLCIHGAGEVNGLGLIVRGKAKSNE